MQTLSKFTHHTECSACGSSDGKAVYSDGSGYCFVCKTHFKASSGSDSAQNRVIPMEDYKASQEAKKAVSGQILSIPDRGITKATCEAYGVMQSGTDHYYPYTDAKGNEMAWKIRDVPNKQFRSQGNIKDALLFGQAQWNAGGRFVTITEGELDALAAYQMMGSKYPVVSIKNGAASAVKDCQAQYEWLDSFETIVIAFDADEPGREAANKVAELFGSKVRVMKMQQGFKDACDYLDRKSTRLNSSH